MQFDEDFAAQLFKDTLQGNVCKQFPDPPSRLLKLFVCSTGAGKRPFCLFYLAHNPFSTFRPLPCSTAVQHSHSKLGSVSDSAVCTHSHVIIYGSAGSLSTLMPASCLRFRRFALILIYF
jgi:hypothetical protein